MNENDKSYFNRFQEGYNPYCAQDLERIISPLDSMLKGQGTALAAEIGCASGQFSRRLKDRYPGLRLLGIDIAEKVLASYPYGKILGSVFELPLADGCLDLVCLPAALHHFYPFDRSLKEIARTIKAGGWLYCLEPNFYHPQRRFFMRFGWLYRLYRKANDVPIRPEALVSLLSGMGFDIERLEYVNIFFRNPSFLQRMQNALYRSTPRTRFDRHILPWFLLLARKRA
ncbi:MAG: class I SAM-dependent methyltransferase [Thermodesulfobacteriota bacterium]